MDSRDMLLVGIKRRILLFHGLLNDIVPKLVAQIGADQRPNK